VALGRTVRVGGSCRNHSPSSALSFSEVAREERAAGAEDEPRAVLPGWLGQRAAD